MSATIIAAAAGDLVEQIGSYAGYASIVGLGVLAMLYFTQAREVKRLREWAGRAPERAAELEERVQSDAQKRVVAQPIAPASAAGVQAADARTQAATAAVYASIGAPPPGTPPPPPGQLARAATPGTVAPAPGAVPPAPAPGAVPAVPAPPPLPSASGATQTPASPPTATPAAPANRPIVTATPAPVQTTPPAATAAARVAASSRAIAPPANGSSAQDTAESDAARPDPLPAPAARPAAEFAEYSDDGGGFSTARIAMIVGAAVAVILIGVVLTFALTGDDATAPPKNSFGDTPAVQDPPAAAEPPAGGSASSALTSAERRATDLAVLNGTTQTGLARAVANKIQDDGFTIASVATNADQSVPTTIVSYTGDNEPAALAVARIVGIDRGSVQAADANTAAAATADVIVIVGSDQIEE